jgi:hypothetical protein
VITSGNQSDALEGMLFNVEAAITSSIRTEPWRDQIRKGDSDKAMEVESNESATLLRLLIRF